MRQINNEGLELIKSFEGLRLSAYKDSVGIWTIGYGHCRGVCENTPDITPAQAQALLLLDLQDCQTEVETLVKVGLNDNQFAALVSLVFNVGLSPLLKTLGRLLNKGDYNGVAEQFLKWNHAGGVALNGLTRRRQAERQLFLTLA